MTANRKGKGKGKATAPPSPAKTATSPIKADWQSRQKNLPRLQQRALSLLDLILGGIQVNKEDELRNPVLPRNLRAWFQHIYADSVENNLETFSETFHSTVPLSAKLMADISRIYLGEGRFIAVKEYATFFQSPGNQKASAIIYLSNLATLLNSLIRLTGEWDRLKAEDRELALTAMDLSFPTGFIATTAGTTEATILCNFRTQRFVHHLLDRIEKEQNMEDDEFVPNLTLGHFFRVGGPQETDSPAVITPLVFRSLMPSSLRMRIQELEKFGL
jgi:hypothetical protein